MNMRGVVSTAALVTTMFGAACGPSEANIQATVDAKVRLAIDATPLRLLSPPQHLSRSQPHSLRPPCRRFLLPCQLQRPSQLLPRSRHRPPLHSLPLYPTPLVIPTTLPTSTPFPTPTPQPTPKIADPN